jgi:glycosyltransferase involved in cell wall biosynthesis
MKSVLFIVHYFYPDYASTGQIMTELCRELQKDFNISVISVVPGYTQSLQQNQYKGKSITYEKFENIDVVRVNATRLDKKKKISRLKHILSYFFNASHAILKTKKHDIVFTISQPPILGGLLGVIAKVFKGSKLIYNIQDFNPEQIEVVNYSKNKFIIEFARWLDNLSCKIADRIIVVGHDMESTLYKRLPKINRGKVNVINNWINEKEVYPLSKEHPQVKEFAQKYGLSDKFIIMYSGNIGLYYDLENIIKVIEKFKDIKDVVFVFVGEGAKRDELVEYCRRHQLNNVKFVPYQPKEQLIYSLNAADVHLVTNQKGIKGVSVPSKIYGVMGAGKAVLGVLEEGSEAWLLIQKSNCGVCSEPQDYDSLEKNIRFCIENRKHMEVFGANGRQYLEKNLTMGQSIDKYRSLLFTIE